MISLRSTKENGDERQQVEKEEEETDVDTGDMVTDEKEELGACHCAILFNFSFILSLLISELLLCIFT